MLKISTGYSSPHLMRIIFKQFLWIAFLQHEHNATTKKWLDLSKSIILIRCGDKNRKRSSRLQTPFYHLLPWLVKFCYVFDQMVSGTTSLFPSKSTMETWMPGTSLLILARSVRAIGPRRPERIPLVCVFFTSNAITKTVLLHKNSLQKMARLPFSVAALKQMPHRRRFAPASTASNSAVTEAHLEHFRNAIKLLSESNRIDRPKNLLIVSSMVMVYSPFKSGCERSLLERFRRQNPETIITRTN